MSTSRPQCRATASRTRRRCRRPAAEGEAVCTVHARRRPQDYVHLTRECDLYRAGHTPHYIQVRKAHEDEEGWGSGRLVGTTAQTLTLAVGGEQRTYGNHDPWRLGQLARLRGRRVRINRRKSLLVLDGFCFSVGPVEIGACAWPVKQQVPRDPRRLP